MSDLFEDHDKLVNDLFRQQKEIQGTAMKTVKRTFAAVFVLWILGVLCGLGLLGAAVWVAAHFISKYW